MTEQIQEEKKQSKMKEQQYNKIIATLNQTVEEKISKSVTQKEPNGNNKDLNSQEWKET